MRNGGESLGRNEVRGTLSHSMRQIVAICATGRALVSAAGKIMGWNRIESWHTECWVPDYPGGLR